MLLILSYYFPTHSALHLYPIFLPWPHLHHWMPAFYQMLGWHYTTPPSSASDAVSVLIFYGQPTFKCFCSLYDSIINVITNIRLSILELACWTVGRERKILIVYFCFFQTNQLCGTVSLLLILAASRESGNDCSSTLLGKQAGWVSRTSLKHFLLLKQMSLLVISVLVVLVSESQSFSASGSFVSLHCSSVLGPATQLALWYQSLVGLLVCSSAEESISLIYASVINIQEISFEKKAFALWPWFYKFFYSFSASELIW